MSGSFRVLESFFVFVSSVCILTLSFRFLSLFVGQFCVSAIFGHVVICMLALSAVRGQCTHGVSPAGKESKGRRGIRDVQ